MQTSARTKCRRCSAPILWARTEAGRKIPLDPAPVPATTRGALCVVGSVALGTVPATRRVAEIFGISEPEAHDVAITDYPWHVAHFATCPSRQHRTHPQTPEANSSDTETRDCRH